jgi:hypothetical protein
MELSKEAFQAWKRQPETKAFFRYLTDKRTEIGEDFVGGLIKVEDHVEHAAEAKLYTFIIDLDYDRDIADFYSK